MERFARDLRSYYAVTRRRAVTHRSTKEPRTVRRGARDPRSYDQPVTLVVVVVSKKDAAAR